MFMTYRDLEDAVLYQRGSQVERHEPCHICGDDTYDDDRQIDGFMICNRCFEREVRRIRNAIRPAINIAAKPNPFERAALAQCLKDILEIIEDE